MSRIDMKNYNIYPEANFTTEDEPEEGEIVDEYDLIVSSDEELNMRQRIRELEAKNEEIEQIAVISRSYDKISVDCSRAAQVPSDVSSISSTEFVTPKKTKRRKNREHRRKHCHRQRQYEQHDDEYVEHIRYDLPQTAPPKSRLKKPRSHCKRRQKLCAKRQKIHSDHYILKEKELNASVLSLESVDSSESSSLTDVDNYNYSRLALKRKESINNSDKYIMRDTLRLAVARNTNDSRLSIRKSCLKDKLMGTDLAGIHTNSVTNEERNFENKVQNGNSNEDDDDDVQFIENEQDIQTIDEDSTDSTEEKELRLIALKSAVLKKHMVRKMRNAEVAYSPTDFDDMLSSGILQLDNQLNDIIDVVDLEGEDSQTACITVSPEASPQLMILDDQDESLQMVDCKPVDMDIANSDSEDATIDSWSKSIHKYPSETQSFGFYMPELHELPPPPPGVEDYDDIPQPPSYNMIYDIETQDMDVDNEELGDDQHIVNKREEEVGEDKEEEEALRALLLSKFQSPKNKRKIKKSIEINENSIKTELQPENSTNFAIKPAETILKEAVKRLKIHTQSDICKEESSVNETVNETPHFLDNNTDSLKSIQKLKSHLNENIKQAPPPCINTDHEIKENSSETSFVEKEEYNNKPHKGYEPSNDGIETKPTNKIDICDITRRLQKIKENVLKLNCNPKPQESTPININSVPQVVLESKKTISPIKSFESKQASPLENICQQNKPLTNSTTNIISTKNEMINTQLTNKKTVKADFDLPTNQTTFKVTFINNSALKLEDDGHKDDNNINKSNDVAFKENNTNNLTAHLNGKCERLVKITNKITTTSQSHTQKNSAAVTKTFSKATKPIIKRDNKLITPLATTASTYHAIRPTTKIVKPNKVINTNFDLNLRPINTVQTNESPKPEKNNHQILKVADDSRLVTNVDQIKRISSIVPMVINLEISSNESCDEGNDYYDTVYKPFYDYTDNTSPLSLNLESPSLTPLRSNSPIEYIAATDDSLKPLVSEEIGLNMNKNSINKEKVNIKTPQINNLTNRGEKSNKTTPLAVRHLPAEAQSEYRRLVHRMKLLENKRKIAEIEEKRKGFSTKNNMLNTTAVATATNSNKEKDNADASADMKTSLVKKVLLRNASNNKTSTVPTDIMAVATTANTCPNPIDKQIPKESSTAAKLHKSNVLKSYENLYTKFGAGIVNNLDKSLKLVEEAKKAKINKLKLETRLKELKAEMDVLQSKHKEEQQKITRIYPSICATNEVITSLKQKRTKVFRAALNLGKTLKGEDYRLNNDLKESINTKSKKLATEIKMVNSLKVQDIKNLEDVIQSSTQQLQLDNKQKQQLTDCRLKSNEQEIIPENSRELKAAIQYTQHKDSNSLDTEIVKQKEQQEDTEKEQEEEDEKVEPEDPLKKQDGGNKEFQSLSENNDAPTKEEESVKNDANEICEMQPNKQLINNKDDVIGATTVPVTVTVPSYISPLEHLRNIDSNLDPNGVICPYDLMGNCEDVTCKYVHIAVKDKN